MKLSTALSLATALLTSTVAAAPADGLHGFPQLTGLNGRDGLANLDRDGVYRLYNADGTVVDAVRLTPAHIDIWINAREPHLPKEETEADRAHFSKIDLKVVRDAQLFAASEDVKPLAMLARYQISRREVSPLEERDGVNGCSSGSCTGTPYICFGKCFCDGYHCRKS